ncbi:MAG: mechanosensitive ion channel family protein [Treponema sp.]
MEEKMSEISDAAISAAEETIITQTSTFIHWVKSFLTWENLFKVIGAVIILLAMWIVYKIILRSIKKVPLEKTNEHKQQIAVKFVKYIFYISVVVYVLGLFGVKLSAIWGAAGIAGVAIGFAAQTSVSNVISGLFVLTERSLKVGDTIIVNGITGVVDTISLLSVRVHTFDNQMVRIPNSTIINSNLTNNSYHDKRRITLGVSISYDADMKTALEVLGKAPALCPTVLEEPAPAVWFDGFGESGIDMTVAAWFKPENFLKTKNDLFIAIKKVLDEAQIEIPFNQLDVKMKQ